MILFVAVILSAFSAYLYVRTRSKTSEPIRHLKKNGALKGILFAFGFALAGTALLYAAKAKADEIEYFKYTSIFAGLDYELNNKVFCYDGDIDDRLTSNLGIRQGLLEKGGAQVYAQYTHHSCALNSDKPTYDAIGVGFEYRVDWR